MNTAAVRSSRNSATYPSALTPPCQRRPDAARRSFLATSRNTQDRTLPTIITTLTAASQTSPGAATAPMQQATSAAVLTRYIP